MRIFKARSFEKFAQENDISDSALIHALERAEKGQVDANLGNGIIKQRVARKKEGKRGGFRTIILLRTSVRAIFIYGFPKNEQENITETHQSDLRKLAPILLNLPDETMENLVKEGEYREVNYDEKL